MLPLPLLVRHQVYLPWTLGLSRPSRTTQVYLELSVEVSKSWRENKQSLEKYGYFDAMYT